MELGLTKFNFKTPCTCLIAGPTSSGKTHMMIRILQRKNDMFDKPPSAIVWCYGVYQKAYDEFESLNIKLYEGIPNIEEIPADSILIIDDLMYKLNVDIGQIFTMHSHHKNISVFFIAQNIFYKNKYMRDLTLNLHYMILLAQRRDISQINTLAGQILPYRRDEFMKVYKEATSEPYGYLLCSFHPRNKHRFYLRYNIFPEEEEIVYYPT